MINFPSLCIDNFLDEPDAIREFALTLDYTPSSDGKYLGHRSPAIHHVNLSMLTTTCKRLLSCFYDLRSTPVTWEVTSYFYKIFPADINTGWVEAPTGNMLDGIVYLNPTAKSNSGISTYSQHWNSMIGPTPLKSEFYKGNQVDIEQYAQQLTDHNNKFEETARFSNRYNRLVAFDGTNFTQDNNFDCGEEFKLIQVFHIKQLVSQYLPLPRLREQGGKGFV